MINNIVSLNSIKIGKSCRVVSLIADGILRRRFLDLGLVSGTEVHALNQSPSGDPIAYLIRGAVIAIRSEDAAKVLVENI